MVGISQHFLRLLLGLVLIGSAGAANAAVSWAPYNGLTGNNNTHMAWSQLDRSGICSTPAECYQLVTAATTALPSNSSKTAYCTISWTYSIGPGNKTSYETARGEYTYNSMGCTVSQSNTEFVTGIDIGTLHIYSYDCKTGLSPDNARNKPGCFSGGNSTSSPSSCPPVGATERFTFSGTEAPSSVCVQNCNYTATGPSPTIEPASCSGEGCRLGSSSYSSYRSDNTSCPTPTPGVGRLSYSGSQVNGTNHSCGFAVVGGQMQFCGMPAPPNTSSCLDTGYGLLCQSGALSPPAPRTATGAKPTPSGTAAAQVLGGTRYEYFNAGVVQANPPAGGQTGTGSNTTPPPPTTGGGTGGGTCDPSTQNCSQGTGSFTGRASTARSFGESLDFVKSSFSTSPLATKLQGTTIASGGTCPAPTIEIPYLDTSLQLDAHCTIAEGIRSELRLVFLAFWSITAIGIFLRP